uniref:Portal protein n=1 Tax=viral metagenome TaxID=1070528 RepID=A0A6H1ZFI1_9ZZZZ
MATANLQDIPGLTRTTIEYLKDQLADERSGHLQSLLAQVASWQPNGFWKPYRIEMADRVDYMVGAMQRDSYLLMEKHFEQTYRELKHELLAFRVVSYTVGEQALCFPDSTKFVLSDISTRKPIDDEDKAQVEFQDMIEESNLITMLQNIDSLTHLCQRCAGKVWWDSINERIQVSAYPPHMVHIVPNPMREWDPQSAIAVLFERPGYEGVRDKPRYEVWGYRDSSLTVDLDSAGMPIFPVSAHYITDGKEDWSVNDDDSNPFEDPRTKMPMMPFTWFKADADEAIYTFGPEDMLTPNRRFNFGMTALQHNIIWQSFGIPTLELPEGFAGYGDLPKKRIISPKHVVELPWGVKLTFVKPDLDVSGPLSFWKAMLAVEAMLSNLNPGTVSFDQSSPSEESGRALLVKNHNRDRHVRKMRPIYKPSVEDLLYRMMVIRKHHLGKDCAFDLNRHWGTWKPGNIEYPIDSKDRAEQHLTKIRNHLETIADWYSEEFGVDKATAMEQVEANKEINNSLRAIASDMNPEKSADDAAADVIGKTQTIEEKAKQGEQDLDEFLKGGK